MLRKILKITVLVVILGLIIVQFFAIDRTNPPISEGETLEAAVAVPADVSQILGRSCNDCHSHKTVYPWYSYVQPSGWFLRGHIDDARRHLNFSKFNTYEPKKKAKKLEEICEEVEAGAMPLPSYLWIHGDAALSKSDAAALCSWAKEARSHVPA